MTKITCTRVRNLLGYLSSAKVAGNDGHLTTTFLSRWYGTEVKRPIRDGLQIDKINTGHPPASTWRKRVPVNEQLSSLDLDVWHTGLNGSSFSVIQGRSQSFIHPWVRVMGYHLVRFGWVVRDSNIHDQ